MKGIHDVSSPLSQETKSGYSAHDSNRVRLVVFDWAGTAVDFGCFGPVASFLKALERRGIRARHAQVRAPMGLPKKDHLRAILSEPDVADQWRARFGRDWDEHDVVEIYEQDYVPLQLDVIQSHSKLVPNLLDVVSMLRDRGIRIGTTTGYFREAGELVFASARGQGYHPDVNMLPDKVSGGRPSPWMIFRIMETLGVYPVTSVVKVGDTIVDIQEGRNAGVWSIGVVSSSSDVGLTEEQWQALGDAERSSLFDPIRSRFLAAGAHAVIESLAELPGLIRDFEDGRGWR